MNIDDESGKKAENQEKKTCLESIVIMPLESVTKQLWDFSVNIALFYGYFRTMYHIAFDIDKSDEEVGHVLD